MNEPKVTRPLNAVVRAWLLAEARRDELGLLRRLKISRSGLMRALSGLPIYGATNAAIEALHRSEGREP